MTGGAGSNVFSFQSGTAGILDLISGGDDTLDFSLFGVPIHIDLADNSAQDVGGGLTLTLTGLFSQIIGTIFDDIIHGNDQDNVILGAGGDDSLDGGAGNDVINGGAGNDALVGGAGDDALAGGADDDLLEGGAGNDLLDGGSGTDTVQQTADADQVLTDASLTGVGNDTLVDVDLAALTGGGSANVLDASGFSGDATLNGLAGDDTLIGGAGDDVLDGGAGDDTYVFDGDLPSGRDELIDAPGDGQDTLDLSTTACAVVLDLGSTSVQTITANLELDLSGAQIEDALSGSGNDTLTGNGADNLLNGGSGDDTLNGGSGNDTLLGGDDADNLNGNDGDDELNGEAGDDMLSGAARNRYAYGGEGADNLNGNDGDDILTGGAGDDVLMGGAGSDSAYGEEGDDVFDGGTGIDLLDGGDGLDTVDNYEKHDTHISIEQGLPGNGEAAGGTTSPTTAFIPVTGGEFVDLSCTSTVTQLRLPDGNGVDFFGLCGYQALVAADYLEGLPGNLPGGARFEYALTIALRHDGLLLGTLPAGASLTPSFAPLALAPGNSLAILFWDTLANAGAGRWAPLVTTNATLAGPVLLQPDLTNDTRQVLEGAHVLPTGRTETRLNFTGTIVLVSGPAAP